MLSQCSRCPLLRNEWIFRTQWDYVREFVQKRKTPSEAFLKVRLRKPSSLQILTGLRGELSSNVLFLFQSRLKFFYSKHSLLCTVCRETLLGDSVFQSFRCSFKGNKGKWILHKGPAKLLSLLINYQKFTCRKRLATFLQMHIINTLLKLVLSLATESFLRTSGRFWRRGWLIHLVLLKWLLIWILLKLVISMPVWSLL